MGRIRRRIPYTFSGPVTFTGSVGLQGAVSLGSNTFVNTVTTVKSVFSGRTTVLSGIALTAITASFVKSNDWFGLTPVITANATQTSLGLLCVRSITEGTGFTIGFTNAGFYGGGSLDVCWEIRHIA